MNPEEIDERYHEAALEENGDGWDDPAELASEDEDELDAGEDDGDRT